MCCVHRGEGVVQQLVAERGVRPGRARRFPVARCDVLWSLGVEHHAAAGFVSDLSRLQHGRDVSQRGVGQTQQILRHVVAKPGAEGNGLAQLLELSDGEGIDDLGAGFGELGQGARKDLLNSRVRAFLVHERAKYAQTLALEPVGLEKVEVVVFPSIGLRERVVGVVGCHHVEEPNAILYRSRHGAGDVAVEVEWDDAIAAGQADGGTNTEQREMRRRSANRIAGVRTHASHSETGGHTRSSSP